PISALLPAGLHAVAGPFPGIDGAAHVAVFERRQLGFRHSAPAGSRYSQLAIRCRAVPAAVAGHEAALSLGATGVPRKAARGPAVSVEMAQLLANAELDHSRHHRAGGLERDRLFPESLVPPTGRHR